MALTSAKADERKALFWCAQTIFNNFFTLRNKMDCLFVEKVFLPGIGAIRELSDRFVNDSNVSLILNRFSLLTRRTYKTSSNLVCIRFLLCRFTAQWLQTINDERLNRLISFFCTIKLNKSEWNCYCIVLKLLLLFVSLGARWTDESLAVDEYRRNFADCPWGKHSHWLWLGESNQMGFGKKFWNTRKLSH